MPHIEELRKRINVKPFFYQVRSAPTIAADISTKTTYIRKIRVHNRAGQSRTITIKDRQGTPFEMYDAVTVTKKELRGDDWPFCPEQLTDGINIVASGADVAVTIEGFIDE